MEFEEPQFVNLVPCTFCGRNFAEENLNRHEKICQKTSRKRPVFNSSKQREVQSSEPKSLFKKNATRPLYEKSKSQSKSNWRQKHEEFIKTVRAARGVTAALKEGKELPPPPPPTINPDYIQCPHCQRRFNENAAERHIRFCAEQAKRLSNKKPLPNNITTQAAMRASARQNYRPPLPQSNKKKIGKTSLQTNRAASGYGNSIEVDHKHSSMVATRAKTFSSNQLVLNKTSNGRVNNPDWDSSVDLQHEEHKLRTKTGLRPSSGVNSHASKTSASRKDLSCSTSTKPVVRKVAGKEESHSEKYAPSSDNWLILGSKKQPRQNHFTYNAGDYDSSDKQYASKKKVGYQYTNRRSKPPNDPNFGCATYSKSRMKFATGTSYQDSDFYNWLESNQDNSHYLHGQVSSYQEPKQNFASSKFCHECGSLFPVMSAKFCCECGTKRILLN